MKFLVIVLLFLPSVTLAGVEITFGGFPTELRLVSGNLPEELNDYDTWRVHDKRRGSSAVTITFTVSAETGNTYNFKPELDSTSTDLQFFLIKAAKSWRFTPPKRHTIYTIVFRLESKRALFSAGIYPDIDATVSVESFDFEPVPWVYGDLSPEEYVANTSQHYIEWARDECDRRFDYWLNREYSALETFVKRKTDCHRAADDFEIIANEVFQIVLPFMGNVEEYLKYSDGLKTALNECLNYSHISAISDFNIINVRTWQPMFNSQHLIRCARDAQWDAAAVEHYRATGEVLDQSRKLEMIGEDSCAKSLLKSGLASVMVNHNIVGGLSNTEQFRMDMRQFFCRPSLQQELRLKLGVDQRKFNAEIFFEGEKLILWFTRIDFSKNWRLTATSVLGVTTALNDAESIAMLMLVTSE